MVKKICVGIEKLDCLKMLNALIRMAHLSLEQSCGVLPQKSHFFALNVTNNGIFVKGNFPSQNQTPF